MSVMWETRFVDVNYLCFFFSSRRRHTRFDCDWSSDVCSSDLDGWADRKRKNVIADLAAHPNISMWVTKQTMIAATTMMWMAEAIGYDTGPMERSEERRVGKECRSRWSPYH